MVETPWSELESSYSCLASLRGCPQDPIHHAEGDVATHVSLVCQCLVQLEAFQELEPNSAPHEDFRCQVHLMSGFPGAGKDTWIRRHRSHLPVISCFGSGRYRLLTRLTVLEIHVHDLAHLVQSLLSHLAGLSNPPV